AALKRSIDVAAWGHDRCASRPGDDLAAQVRYAHPETFEVADRVDLLPEPSCHLRCGGRDGAGHHVERGGGLYPELDPSALEEPRGHAQGIHAERNRAEPLERRLPVLPVLWRCHERLDLAPRCGLEEVERQGELAGREDLDAEPAPAH